MIKRLLCKLGFHHWRLTYSASVTDCYTCARCGKQERVFNLARYNQLNRGDHK